MTSPPATRDALAMEDMLVRAHKNLIISYRSDSDMVALRVETWRGPVEEFAINDVAREAIAFVARENMFEVRDMPGNLSDEERIAIGEMLEETGLFSRVRRGIANPALARERR
jgi:hypothetical protein